MKHRTITKLLALALALCLLAGAVPLSASAAEYSGTCGANLKWEISGGTLTISGTGEMNDVALGADAPWEPFADSFTKIVVESGVTTIGDYTFTDLAGVTEVTLPDTLTSIGLYAFGGCESLQGITIPSCESIAHGAFRGCENLAYALLPENLTYIGQYAFSYTHALTQITLPSGLTTLRMCAFMQSGLTSVNLPSGVEMEIQVFEHAPLESVEIAYGVEAIPMNTFIYCDKLQSVTIPGSVKSIGASAFQDCTSLSSVTIEEGLEKVEENAFRGCTSLEEVTFPSTCVDCNAALRDTSVKTVTFLNPDCKIRGAMGKVGVTTIRGYADSAVQEFATSSGYAFEALEGEPEVPVSFTDVHEGDYFYQPVLWAVENDITAGTSATTFGPGLDCTREQAMMFLWKAAGKPQPTSSYNPFTDVKPDAYYYDAVLWAVEEGITSGVSDTKFGTGSPCTRGQIMTFLYKAAGSPSVSGNNPFGDVKSGDYFYSPVLWAVRNNITSGTSATTFSPSQTCTRGQIVTFLYKHYA